MLLNEFVVYMGDLKEFEERMEKLNDAICVCNDCNIDLWYTLFDSYIELLEKLMVDKNEWISYYIFETGWGKNYKDGMVKDKNGINLPLKTIEDVYKLIKGENCED